ncbi:hypothetical protein IWX81_001281 [Salinibacterium sp. CAN_S4]|uniref:hypothetical protein n=1 Tax=Salinibacterium sp. CAN_S4 TaxID=2787727 RepID=UPI0018F03493
MSDSRNFDPRFDPAFQRGFVDDDSRAPQRHGGIEALGLGGEPIGLPPQPVESREAAVAEVPAHPEPVAVSLEGNPWVKVLWVIAPVFILGGLIGQAWAQSLLFNGSFTSGPSAFESYVVPSVVQAVGPWMVLTGLAALVGVVFLHAVRWRAAE